jgi:cell division cycle 14
VSRPALTSRVARVRLYFTTFPDPAPDPQLLNGDDPAHRPPRPVLRARNHHGARTAPADDGAPYYFFTVDDQLVYLSFFQDWGPLNLAMVYKACILFHELLQVGHVA